MTALIPIFIIALFGFFAFTFGLLSKTSLFSFLDTKESLADSMRSISKKRKLEEFIPSKTNDGKKSFEFKDRAKETYLYQVVVDSHSIVCNVKNIGLNAIVAHITFDKKNGVFLAKNISSSSINRGKKDLDIFEKFVKTVVEFDWEIDTSIEVTNSDIVPQRFLFAEEAIKSDKLTSLLEMKKLIESKEENNVLLSFKEAISKTEELFLEIENHDFDIETKHMVNRLLTEDISSLFYPYLQLSKEEKENYEEKILIGLEKIKERVNNASGKMKTNSSDEIEKALELIQKRY